MGKINTLIGSKYYTHNGDSTKVIRLVRFKNKDIVVVKDESGNTFKMRASDLDSYTRLLPDGYVSFVNAGLDSALLDVIVSFHRRSDMEENGDTIPYAVCRQSSFDMFSFAVQKENDTVPIGFCVSKDTCPNNVKYETMVACSSVSDMNVVCIYLDDTLDEMLSYINQYKYDSVLNKYSSTLPKLMKASGDNRKLTGLTFNVKQLLEENCFMDEIYRGFGLTKVDFKVDFNEENALNAEQALIIENMIKRKILSTFVVKFDRSIKLSDIKNSHVKIIDSNNQVYIVAYKDGGYTNPAYDKFEDKLELEAMVKPSV